MPRSPEEEAFAEAGSALADALLDALPGWAERVVVARGGPADAAAAAGRSAAALIEPELRALLAADIDDQHDNPLAVLRAAVVWPTQVLRDAGVEPVERDEFSRAHFPDDDYDLTPMTWADLDENLVEQGVTWGAMKAHVHMKRHGAR
jgi:hypothetical protein